MNNPFPPYQPLPWIGNVYTKHGQGAGVDGASDGSGYGDGFGDGGGDDGGSYYYTRQRNAWLELRNHVELLCWLISEEPP